jgi:hypothetical protein
MHRPLMIGVVSQVGAGALMAATALIAAITHHQTGQAWTFLALTLILILAATAAAVGYGVRWVTKRCASSSSQASSAQSSAPSSS